MGKMVDGVWRTDDEVTATSASGAWERTESVVRHWITSDGAAGPTGDAGFKAEPGRYHLYVAPNCPWAHRARLMRVLKCLEDILPVSATLPRRTDQGWVFGDDAPHRDRLFGAYSLHEIYARGVSCYSGRVTVPVLWDTGAGRMVSNESADIVRMLNSAFAEFAPNTPDLYPQGLETAIDDWNATIYSTLNNGVYRAGFAGNQQAYEEAAGELFSTLDALEEQLGRTEFVACDTLTEVDVRLFPTLARFDVAYNTAFKCNRRRLQDYPRLWLYARRFYRRPGIAETVEFETYKRGYFSPSEKRNPFGIIPIGPDIDWRI